MSFLRPKVNIPPPPPPPAPPPAAVVRPTNVVDTTKENMKTKKASARTAIMTGPQGLTTDAPIQYASLLGASKRTKQPGE